MGQLRIYKLDSVENRQTPLFFTGEQQRFININPFETRLTELREIKELPENWDGYGAIPILNEVFETSQTLLTLLSGDLIERIFDIYPNPHGTISIEWINRKSEKLSLEIGKTSYSFFIKFLDSNPQFNNGQDILTDIAVLTNSLDNLFREDIPKFFL